MEITGYASTASLDRHGDVVVSNAFTDSIRRRGLTGPRGVRLLLQHRAEQPLGAITKLEQRNDGLWIEATIEEGISYGKDAALATKAAGGLNFSVGFRIIDADFVTSPSGYEYLEITKGDLHEVSVVTFPANEEAEMITVGEKNVSLAETINRMKQLSDKLAELAKPRQPTWLASLEASEQALKRLNRR